ncbi:twin-arginine translocase subunit TatC [Leptolyngbya sp. 7M]|uniref:twin-arginine translocase subunit TatC n=1 Tax=Leptolyngbya sp. 7M TaxID=2812896 RepID=UPI00293950DE|nr:twin-arginine translocase subunit TatC [Leptolyngbya sp. 7M]
MSLFDHLEELRLRIFYALIAVVLGIIVCFVFVNPIVRLLEVPAQGAKFLQLAPGEYFFVSLKVAGYSGVGQGYRCISLIASEVEVVVVIVVPA